MEKKKIVFLYTELATYFLACVEELLKQPCLEVHIVRWPLNKVAPFHFKFGENLKIYNRNDYRTVNELRKLVSDIGPDIIYSSGWMDKGYLKICKAYKKEIPVIVGFDNQWKGTLRQQIARFISPFRILSSFSHCWIPGSPQMDFAIRLGFKKENIFTGFYCCDYNFFHDLYISYKTLKQNKYPKRFIYIGRYVENKGINDLWTAFIELQKESSSDWELWCLGTGEIKPVDHPKIKHFGFVQPADLPAYIKETGVFVLPSHFEPWGVVVHEFAAAGFPLVCSDEVGARSAFVENNFNGYIYKSGDIAALKKVLGTIIDSDQEKLLQMSENSVKKAKQNTPEIWTKKIISLL